MSYGLLCAKFALWVTAQKWHLVSHAAEKQLLTEQLGDLPVDSAEEVELAGHGA